MALSLTLSIVFMHSEKMVARCIKATTLVCSSTTSTLEASRTPVVISRLSAV